MLIVNNLKKTYKTKGGVTVHALDDVSIAFPENGMVFLLGKSGSGKSTLLNMIGGLDRVDSGEIIVKGKNSKTFSGADYDSYRNTYIGFIFQEYNILNEFNVEQNISLALQLQGKPNDKKAVEAILEQVDLKGLGKRKPNTLSGGQKQRVAIARALIKNPEIIMADEPTGALDSNTGKQVFETLKRLSKDKLVIVVSHDRDFAEIYGDRIIELSDGKIISDTTKEYIAPTVANENVHIVNDHTVAIKDTSKLTESDMKVILDTLKNSQGEAVISSGEHDLALVRQAIHLNLDNSSEVFHPTEVVYVKDYDPKQTKFIRSKLPFSRAFKMGSSSLKLKPVRLVFTSLLTSVALAMFGLSSTLMLFKESYSISQALQKSDYDSEVISKYYNYTYKSYNLNIETGEKIDEHSYPNSDRTLFDSNDIDHLNNNNVGHKFAGLITFHEYDKRSSYSYLDLKDNSKTTEYYYYNAFLGFSDAGSGYLSSAGLRTIAGHYPTSANELMISNYLYNVLELTDSNVNSYEDLFATNYQLRLRGNYGSQTVNAKIVGVFDAGIIPSRFDKLKTPNELNRTELTNLEEDFANYLINSYQTVAFVSGDFYQTYAETLYKYYSHYSGNYSSGLYGVRFSANKINQENVQSDNYQNVISSKVFDYLSEPIVYDANGEKIPYVAPKEDEIYIASYYFEQYKTEQLRYYYESLNDLCNNLAYDAEAYNELQSQTDKLFELRNRLSDAVYFKESYPEGYSYEEDRAYFDNIMNKYFVKVQERHYVHQLAWRLMDGFNRENGDYANVDDFPEYKTFRDNVNAITNTTPYNMNNYESIKSYVLADPNQYLKHNLLYTFASNVWEENDQRETIKSYLNQYCSQVVLSEETWDEIKDYVNKYYNFGYYDQLEPDLSIIKVMPDLKGTTIYYKTYTGRSGELKVIGYLDSGEYLLNHSLIDSFGGLERSVIYVSEQISSYTLGDNAKYSFAITHTNFEQNQVAHLLSHTETYGYNMTDDVYAGLVMILSLITTLKQVFLIAGIVFGVFAALMLFNFITTSIAAKTKEIGILRAVGARGNDLFKIFFSESGLIAFICSIIAIAASIVVCWRLNVMMMERVGLSMLNFGPINVGLILFGAVVIAMLGTLIPVIIAAKKPPVESIRTL